MQIGKILYPITTLGRGVRVGIWTQGCNAFCKGCSNPELQIFDSSKDIDVIAVFNATMSFKFDGVTISGGEPFLQSAELRRLVELYYDAGYRDILVYSGFTYQQLLAKKDSDIDYILSHIAVLIDGRYIQELADDVPLRGSSNQRVIVFDKTYLQDYKALLSREKTVDIFCFDDEVHFIGVPFRDYDKVYKQFVSTRRKQ